jgi:hypothetical protein
VRQLDELQGEVNTAFIVVVCHHGCMDPTTTAIVNVVSFLASLAFLAFAIWTVRHPEKVSEFFIRRNGSGQTPSQTRTVGIVFVAGGCLFVIVATVGIIQNLG